jgi:putative addiction module component (TIGR02574 family)
MSATAERIRSELTALTPAERAELAHFLIASLEGESDSDAEKAWDAELAQRAEEIRSGSAVGYRAEDVFAELRAKHS